MDKKINGLSVKDLVTTGIFSALYIVFMFMGGLFFAPNPVLTAQSGQIIGLLFDEPTSGLDLGIMIQVRDLFYNLAGQNKLIFVISHDYEFMGAVCSRIIRLHQGRIAKDFLPEEQGRLSVPV